MPGREKTGVWFRSRSSPPVRRRRLGTVDQGVPVVRQQILDLAPPRNCPTELGRAHLAPVEKIFIPIFFFSFRASWAVLFRFLDKLG